MLRRCAAVSGHVGPNFGDVEAVIALHYVFDAPIDSIVFDVSHQDFAHKMLTGRVDAFIDLARYSSVGEYTDTTDLSVKQIAARLHYDDPSYLCRLFRKQTGMSPLEYRHQPDFQGLYDGSGRVKSEPK